MGLASWVPNLYRERAVGLRAPSFAAMLHEKTVNAIDDGFSYATFGERYHR